jgi:hypothetical protein
MGNKVSLGCCRRRNFFKLKIDTSDEFDEAPPSNDLTIDDRLKYKRKDFANGDLKRPSERTYEFLRS